MKKVIVFIAYLFCLAAHACQGFVIGFKGINDAFDNKAFAKYAEKQKYCAKSFSWHQTREAISLINTLSVPYHLYGYSRGAGSVSVVLQHVLTKPQFTVTIGAYRTADVNFDRYGIEYVNYFDHSGIGQRSPGIFLNVSHWEIQRKVNNIVK